MSSLVLRLYCALRSSKKLHDESFLALMRSPLSYFEATPQGRILNLFTRDIFVVDEVLPNSFGAFFRTVSFSLDARADRPDYVGTRSCRRHRRRCALRLACLHPSGLLVPHCDEVSLSGNVSVADQLATTLQHRENSSVWMPYRVPPFLLGSARLFLVFQPSE